MRIYISLKVLEDSSRNLERSDILKISIRLIFIFSILVALTFLLVGCSGGYPYEKGRTVMKNISIDKSTSVGDLKKTGWQLAIQEDTFSEDKKLTMKVLSELETKDYQNADFAFYGTPVEITLNDQEHTRLDVPVSITLQIPKEHLRDLVAEELFFASYYNGEWEYLLPDSINLDNGTATIKVHHFSFWAFGRPSEEKQIETYAKNLAALQWDNQNRSLKIKDALTRQYDDLFKSMGVNSDSLCGQLTADMLSALEDATIDSSGIAPIDALAQLANAASKGQSGMDEYRNKYLELTGKMICHVMEKSPEKFSSYANVLGGLGTVAGAMSEGDTEGALRGVADMLRGSDPIVAVADTALTFIKDSMENAVDIWGQGELEKGYQVYIGGAAGRWGSDSGLDGDIDAVFITMGGGEREFTRKIVKRYCDKYGIKEDNLTQEERDNIVDNAKIALQRKFDERKISEPAIEEIKQKEQAFIAELKADGLLDAYSYEKYFGMDKGVEYSIGDRLAKLYKIRNLVLSYVDKDKVQNLTDKQIAILIRQWILYSEKKDRAGFFKYMRDSEFIVEPLIKDPVYAWVFEKAINFDKQKELKEANEQGARDQTYQYAWSSREGVYEYTQTYIGDDDSWYDPPKLNGETYTARCTWTIPPTTIKAGETITLDFNLSFTSHDLSFFTGNAYANADIDNPDIGIGTVTGGNINLVNKDGKSSFMISTYKTVQVYSLSDTVTAVAPAGREEGDKIAIRTSFNGYGQGTAYVYVWTRTE